MLENILKNYNIILASASPRRKQLLEQMGISFTILPRDINEDFPAGMEPVAVAEFLSLKKAEAFAEKEINSQTLIITADTIVAVDGKILGKPGDKTHAAEILASLSGKTHLVVTGVTLRKKGSLTTFSASTRVTFKELKAEEIEFYLENYKPYDKAGAYGIQEWIGHVAISKIEGSFYNVMGLPTYKLHNELQTFLSTDGL
jgi:septum formation protein